MPYNNIYNRGVRFFFGMSYIIPQGLFWLEKENHHNRQLIMYDRLMVSTLSYDLILRRALIPQVAEAGITPLQLTLVSRQGEFRLLLLTHHKPRQAPDNEGELNYSAFPLLYFLPDFINNITKYSSLSYLTKNVNYKENIQMQQVAYN